MAQQVLCAFGLLCNSGNLNYNSFEVVNNEDNVNYNNNYMQKPIYYPASPSITNIASPCTYFDYTSNNGVNEGSIHLPSQIDASIVLRVEFTVAAKLSVSLNL